MRRSRPQFRLSTLLAAIPLAGLVMGSVRAWRKWDATMPKASDRIASRVLAMRAARPTPGGSNTQDAIPMAGLVIVALSASSLWRGLRGRIISTPGDRSC